MSFSTHIYYLSQTEKPQRSHGRSRMSPPHVNMTARVDHVEGMLLLRGTADIEYATVEMAYTE